jgi:hypothetical protein
VDKVGWGCARYGCAAQGFPTVLPWELQVDGNMVRPLLIGGRDAGGAMTSGLEYGCFSRLLWSSG